MYQPPAVSRVAFSMVVSIADFHTDKSVRPTGSWQRANKRSSFAEVPAIKVFPYHPSFSFQQ
jgi:hypothetical protein